MQGPIQPARLCNSHVVEPSELCRIVDELAEQIASTASYAIATGKRSLYRQLQMPVSDACASVGEVHVRNMAHPDAMEGIGAFIGERRAGLERLPLIIFDSTF